VVVDRLSAIAMLDGAQVPLDVGITATEWRVGGAMLQFPGVTPGGVAVRDAGPDYWSRQLLRIKAEGFDSVEVPSAWLPIGEMAPAQRRALAEVLEATGLGVCATSVVRQSVIDPRHWKENLRTTHRAIDAAVEIGATIVCLGLHEALTHEQLAVPWFWTMPGATNPDDKPTWRTAVERFRDLADHASRVGIEISLELYEGTYLGSSDSAVAFVTDIDRENVGLNPDLGNLVRAQVPIEPWEALAVKVMPLANYWHVKNYSRAEDPTTGTYFTTPMPLSAGLIDYRKTLAFAIAAGFRGPILCEHYGGDGLAVSADNAKYLRRVLADVLSLKAGSQAMPAK
jgi:sugar phosphate isomerase/epimerase